LDKNAKFFLIRPPPFGDERPPLCPAQSFIISHRRILSINFSIRVNKKITYHCIPHIAGAAATIQPLNKAQKSAK
jgi:hypothetical protein